MLSEKTKKQNDAIKGRKWLLTINNPLKEEYNGYYELEALKKMIPEKFSTIKYYCYSMEIGAKENTPHIHIYLQFKSPVSFKMVKKYFPAAHIELGKGNPAQLRAYVFKTDKWEATEKGTTNLRDSHFEYGEPPEGNAEKKTSMSGLYDLIKAGKTDLEICEEAPQYLFQLEKIEKIRQKLAEEYYNKIFRNMFVIYIWGRTGSGKSSYVLQTNDIDTVYRVTDYERDPFGSYDTVKHRTIIFDEFRGQLRLYDMLNYLDGHPVKLTSRYSNKTGSFDKVYIVGNEPLQSLYPNVQLERPETWRAFRRRIDLVVDFNQLEAQGLTDFESKFTLIKAMEAEVWKRKHQVELNQFDSKSHVRKIATDLLPDLLEGTVNQLRYDEYTHQPVLMDGEEILYYSYFEKFEFR